MTCIVGFLERKNVTENGTDWTERSTVWMGGDAAGTNGWFDQVIYESPKVFRNGEMLIGSCGSARQAQLLRYVLNVPDYDPRLTLEKYMVKVFIEAVRACFGTGGVRQKLHEVESSCGHFIVGFKGRLFVVYEDFQVRVPRVPWAAVGCGDQIANGAMFASQHLLDGRARVELALQASEQFSAGVRGPFHIESLPVEEKPADV